MDAFGISKKAGAGPTHTHTHKIIAQLQSWITRATSHTFCRLEHFWALAKFYVAVWLQVPWPILLYVPQLQLKQCRRGARAKMCQSSTPNERITKLSSGQLELNRGGLQCHQASCEHLFSRGLVAGDRRSREAMTRFQFRPWRFSNFGPQTVSPRSIRGPLPL